MGVGRWGNFWGWGVWAGEGFEEGLDCIHGGRVAGGVGFGQWLDVRGVWGGDSAWGDRAPTRDAPTGRTARWVKEHGCAHFGSADSRYGRH